MRWSNHQERDHKCNTITNRRNYTTRNIVNWLTYIDKRTRNYRNSYIIKRHSSLYWINTSLAIQSANRSFLRIRNTLCIFPFFLIFYPSMKICCSRHWFASNQSWLRFEQLLPMRFDVVLLLNNRWSLSHQPLKAQRAFAYNWRKQNSKIECMNDSLNFGRR